MCGCTCMLKFHLMKHPGPSAPYKRHTFVNSWWNESWSDLSPCENKNWLFIIQLMHLSPVCASKPAVCSLARRISWSWRSSKGWYLTPFLPHLFECTGTEERLLADWEDGSEGKILILHDCWWREWGWRQEEAIPIPISNQYPHNEIPLLPFYIAANSLFIRTLQPQKSQAQVEAHHIISSLHWLWSGVGRVWTGENFSCLKFKRVWVPDIKVSSLSLSNPFDYLTQVPPQVSHAPIPVSWTPNYESYQTHSFPYCRFLKF